MSRQYKLFLPTDELIRKANWMVDAESADDEKALQELFSTYPSNTNYSHVLWKVIVLNRVYSTQILAVQQLARYIVNHSDELDHFLQDGSTKAVDLFSKVNLGGKERNLFSFASKYCSWHNPDDYPIFDSRVGWYLWHLNKQIFFAPSLTRYEFMNYAEFKNVVIEFQRRFQLETCKFKSLDKFLWLHGDPNSYTQTSHTDAVSEIWEETLYDEPFKDDRWNNSDFSEDLAKALDK